MKFRILGPLEVVADSGRLEVGGARRQVTIATLLLNARRVVPVERLLEAVYGENLPPTCRSQVQISISWLRRLFASHGQPGIISTHPNGYSIQIDDAQLDSRQFQRLVATAREADDPEQAVAKYRDALRLWQGSALHGIDSDLIRAAASRLDELRISVNEDRIDLELDLGRHHELVGELTEFVEEYPLRERLHGQLMLALHNCGRTAEALQVYRQAQQTIVEELGLDPGEHLQQLHQAILTSDPTLKPLAELIQVQPVKPQGPSLLPADIGDFIGRSEQIEDIRTRLVDVDGAETRPVVPVLVIVGAGGVGKTAMAVHASHGIADHFPDGQLFADLHGSSGRSVGPREVLKRFIRALGVPAPLIPDGLDERAETYRNLLAHRKVLIVLDDAVRESQVRPLLPGSGAAAVIVTARTRLPGIPGATHLEAGVFDTDKSLDLLSHIAGSARVRAQPEAAATVAEHCGHLPLALRIAGARLAAQPNWNVERLVDRLADETHRLDELRYHDMGIRQSISVTYDNVGEPVRQLFRRLALLDMPTFSSWVSAPLLDQPVDRSEDLLDELVNAQLVQISGTGLGVHTHYRFHELIRLFARERIAEEESPAECSAALERMLGALLQLADEAGARHNGDDHIRVHSEAPRWPLPRRLVNQVVMDPLSWCDRNRTPLVAGVRQAAQAGFPGLCWSLAFSVAPLFGARRYFGDCWDLHGIALAAARKAKDTRGQAAMLCSMASLYMAQGRLCQADRELIAAARLFRHTADEQGMALVNRHISTLNQLNGWVNEPISLYEKAAV